MCTRTPGKVHCNNPEKYARHAGLSFTALGNLPWTGTPPLIVAQIQTGVHITRTACVDLKKEDHLHPVTI